MATADPVQYNKAMQHTRMGLFKGAMIIGLLPIIAHANAILPGAAFAMGLQSFWYVGLIVIFIEALVLRLLLQEGFHIALIHSIMMNIVSTMIGFLLMYIMDLSFFFSAEKIAGLVRTSTAATAISSVIIIILYVLVYFVSTIIVELTTLKWMGAKHPKLRNIVIYTNLSTYLFFLIISGVLWGIVLLVD